MYTKHHTKALVLTAYDSGEADRVFSLLTPDFGKVYAKANGVREHKARHKGALQPMSEAHVSLVRGKTGWRITNVTAHRSYFAELASQRIKLFALVRVLKLIRRLVAGEGSADKVFSITSSFADAVASEITAQELSYAETLVVLRLLSALGYLKQDERFAASLSDPADFSKETLTAFAPHVRTAVKILNESLQATQL